MNARALPSPDQLPASTQAALKSLLKAAHAPFAPSIAQLATEHLPFFKGMRTVGAHWPQIAEFLYEQGLRSPSGKISGDVWRATVSRALRIQETRSAAIDVNTTSDIAAKQTEMHRDASLRSTAQQGVTECSAPKLHEMKRNAPKQSETACTETRGNTAHPNGRVPSPAAPTQTPPELQEDNEIARRAALIDKPFSMR